MFTQALKDTIVVDNHSDGDGVHQAILDVAYADWQKHSDWGQAEMLDNAMHTYGELACLAVQIGKYNQQVLNGGHAQYWDNGYASAKSDGIRGHTDCILHENLIDLFTAHGLLELKHGPAVMVLLVQFRARTEETGICCDCDGAGGWEEDDYDDHDYGDEDYPPRQFNNWDECGACSGSGESDSDIGNTDDLDTLYYAIYEEWMDELEVFFTKHLNN